MAMPFGGRRRAIGCQSSAAQLAADEQTTSNSARTFGNAAGVIEWAMRGIMVRVGAPHNRPAARGEIVGNFRDSRRQISGLSATGGVRDTVALDGGVFKGGEE
jgi:hypothetical protein